MALNIKDPDTDRLARELAELTGESITTALHRAIKIRLERERSRRQSADTQRAIAEIILRGRARTVLDPRPADEILGYDADGLPT